MDPRVNDFGQPIGPDVPGWTPPPPPDPGVLQGSSVRLERLTRDHVPGLFAGACDPADAARWTYMPQGPFRDEADLWGYLEPMTASPDWAPLAIVSAARGEVLGMAAYLRIRPAEGAVEVGSIFYGPALARTAGATEAMALMARHVFDDLGYRRYEWKCDALHTGSRRAARRLGFSYEGCWRNAVMYKGRSRDTAWYAMTDDDWPQVSAAYDAWLAGAGADGQAQSLSALTRPLLRDGCLDPVGEAGAQAQEGATTSGSDASAPGRHRVAAADTAVAVGSGEVKVLATPRLIAWLEQATVAAAARFVSGGQTTVGTQIRVRHRRPTPVGGTVEVVAEPPEAPEERRLLFTVRATDEAGELVAAGEIERVIVDREQFPG